MQCHAPTKISDVVALNAFYEQSYAVQKRLPTGNTVIVMSDPNGDIDSGNTLLEHLMGKPDFGNRKPNGDRFMVFYNFRRNRACHKVSWFPTNRQRTNNQIDQFSFGYAL